MPNWKKLITSGSSASLYNLVADNHISASLLSGSFYGDGSNLTGVGFPYTGDAQINGGLGVSGSIEFAYNVAGPSVWSAGGPLITTRRSLAGAGTQNAGLASGGNLDFSPISCTEEYNGSSWSAGGALSTARYDLAGAGTQNAGLAFGGYF